jgi:hypothetical protein
LLRNSIQRELNEFFSKINNEDFSIQHVSKGAFSLARKKISHTAFEQLSEEAVKEFYNQAPYIVWGGFRVLAVDGSRLLLPNSDDIAKDFPTTGFGQHANCHRSMASISLVYDVFNQVTLSAKMDTFKCPEIALFNTQLDEVCFKENDLILLDRGYSSAPLLYKLFQRKLNFCVRLSSRLAIVKEMLTNGQTDEIVTFKLKGRQLKDIKQNELTQEIEFSARVVIFDLENGEKEILCTSLLCQKDTTIEELKWLYHQRWSEEEMYKLLKLRMDIENFSGLTSLSVKQDFYAAIFTMNMTAILGHPISERIKKEVKEAKVSPRKINKANAVSFISKSLVGIFIKNNYEKCLQCLDDILLKTTEIVRPGRTFPRIRRVKKPKSHNYKPM